MFKVSEAMAIALHSMIYITNKGNKVTSLKEIAQKFKISEYHLSKVLQRLVKEGVIISNKGPHGGFLTLPEYKNMTFLEIYEIMEGKIKKHNCLFNSNTGDCTNCIMGNLIEKMNEEFINYLRNNKIFNFKL
jgi:Rrf2 family protein